MTKEQQSSNAESASQHSSRQASNTDAPDFRDEVAFAIHQIALELQKSNNKPKLDLLALSGLIISLISLTTTLLLGTVGAIYLYGKQAQTNLNYSLAHLALDVVPTSNCPSKTTLGCLAELQVTNKGPASATGITVDVFLQKISDPWKASIKDINDFTINTLPSNRHIPFHPFYDTDPSALDKVIRNNAYELTINSLPPPSSTSSIQIDLGLSPHLPVITRTANISTTLYIGSQNSQSFNFGIGFPTGQVIQKYFDQFFSIANFEVNVTCQNCTNDPDPLVSNTSSLDKSALAASLNPLNPFNSIWAGLIKVSFEQPKQSSLPALGNALYLWTVPTDPTDPLDSLTQAYLGIVTSCVPTGQSGGSQDICTPNSTSGNGGGI